MIRIWWGGVLLRPASALVVVVVSLSVTTGCGTLANGRRWGQDAFSRANLKTVARAAQDAFFDLQTLLPAAGAIIFAASGLDHEVSDWATDHTPLFGSQETAQEASDYLREAPSRPFSPRRAAARPRHGSTPRPKDWPLDRLTRG